MKNQKYLLCGILTVCIFSVLAIADTFHLVAPGSEYAPPVILPIDDPLMNAIKQRFGTPDRITGTGRAFLHYDLATGDTITLVVSGRMIIGLQHSQREELQNKPEVGNGEKSSGGERSP